MEPVLFILLIAVSGSSGFGIFNQCDISRCDTFTPHYEEKTMRNFPPNEEELREICPPLLEAIECSSSIIEECTGALIEQLSGSDNDSVAQMMSMVRDVMSLIKDVCDEESQLGRDFRASAPCLKEIKNKKIFSVEDPDCQSVGNRLYAAFRFPKGYDEEDEGLEIVEGFYEDEIPDKFHAEMRCLTAASEMACVLKDTEKTCGSVARDVLSQLVKRLKMLRMGGICTEEDLLTLRGEFLDFLEEQGEHRAFLANAFEFRKRRK